MRARLAFVGGGPPYIGVVALVTKPDGTELELQFPGTTRTARAVWRPECDRYEWAGREVQTYQDGRYSPMPRHRP